MVLCWRFSCILSLIQHVEHPQVQPRWKTDMMISLFPRLAASPDILGGKPCIKGTRLSVQFVMELIADGASTEQIIEAYPHITAHDIQECVRYAAESLRHEMIADIAIDVVTHSNTPSSSLAA